MDPAQLAPLDLALGVLLLIMATITMGLRIYGRADLLGWRESLQQAIGDKLGDAAHFVLYTVSPALLGLAFIWLWSIRRTM